MARVRPSGDPSVDIANTAIVPTEPSSESLGHSVQSPFSDVEHPVWTATTGGTAVRPPHVQQPRGSPFWWVEEASAAGIAAASGTRADGEADNSRIANGRPLRGFLQRLRALHRCVCIEQERPTYPLSFKCLLLAWLSMAVIWVGNYCMVVEPAMNQHTSSPCPQIFRQLKHNAHILFVYFTWFVIARFTLFLPLVATWVHRMQRQSFCRDYCIRFLLRDGPVYIFVYGALLSWVYLSQRCWEDRPPNYHRAFVLHAVFSNVLSVFSLAVSCWHNKLLAQVTALLDGTTPRASAPLDTVLKLESHSYDEALFGDEEGKPYAAECSICLGNWESDDEIKVTPCGHAFHKECIRTWLRMSRTCALCRQDLVRSTSGSHSSGNAGVSHDGATRTEGRAAPVQMLGNRMQENATPAP